MIRYTDTDKVPPLFFKAMRLDNHPVAGTMSVSELIAPPQIKYLKIRNELTESAPDRLWALVGTAIHGLLERAATADNLQYNSLLDAADTMDVFANNSKGEDQILFQKVSKFLKQNAKKIVLPINPDYVVEETLSYEIDGITLYGTYDIRDLKLKRIEDYKFTKVWAYIFKESKEEWAQQLNVYRWMCSKHGIEVDLLRIWGLFRDWSEMKIMTPGYPKFATMPIDLPVWRLEDTEAFVRERIRLHKITAAGNIIECTGKDRWATGNTYKIKSPTVKRSLANFDDLGEAMKRLQKEQLKNPKIYMETIPGENKRCERYCPVRKVCPQWKKFNKN